MKIDTVFLENPVKSSNQSNYDLFGDTTIEMLAGTRYPKNDISAPSSKGGNSPISSGNNKYIPNAYRSITSKNKYGRLSKGGSFKVNPDDVKSYLQNKGYSKSAIAGILANIEGESAFNSLAVGDNGNAFGFFQHNGVRKDALLDHLNSNNLDRSDWRAQIDFMDAEITADFKKKLNNSTPQEAADLFTRGYERPANVGRDAALRATNSMKYFKYGGHIPTKDMGGYINSGGYINQYEKPNVGGSIVNGAVQGFSLGASTGNVIGMIAGTVIGGVAGAIGGSRKKRRYNEAAARQNRQMNKYMEDQSKSVLASYDEMGTSGQYGYYKFGGKIPKNIKTQTATVEEPEYEVEKGEVVQGTDVILEESKSIASDMLLVEGSSHEEGGVLGQGGDRVYSNSLRPNESFENYIRKAGIKLKTKNATYGEIATELGLLKGKFENKSISDDYIVKNTGINMLGKVNQLIDLTFEAQEAQKRAEGIVTDDNSQNGNLNDIMEESYFKFGGIIPKYFNGADLGNDVDKKKSIWNYKSNKDANSPKLLNNVNSVVGLGVSALGLINDLTNVKKMNTEVPFYRQNNPTYNYRDRSGVLRNSNRAMFRNLVNNPNNRNGLTNQLAFAQMLKQDTEIANAENARKDAYDANYLNMVRQNEGMNLNRATVAAIQSNPLANSQLEARRSSVNNALGNLSTVFKEADLIYKDQTAIDVMMKQKQAELDAINGKAPEMNNTIYGTPSSSSTILNNSFRNKYLSRNYILGG